MVHRQITARKKADGRFELIGLAWILGQYHDGIVMRGSQFCCCQCGAGANELAPAERLPGLRQLLRRADEEGLVQDGDAYRIESRRDDTYFKSTTVTDLSPAGQVPLEGRRAPTKKRPGSFLPGRFLKNSS